MAFAELELAEQADAETALVGELVEALEASLDMELPGSVEEWQGLEDRVALALCCLAQEIGLAEVVEAVVEHIL